MNWIVIALFAQFIVGTSAVFDKLLLKRKFFDPWVYTFWLAIAEFVVITLAPFIWVALPIKIIVLALITGAVFILTNFLFYKALSKDEVSETLPIIGGLSPLFTLLISFLLLKSRLDLSQLIGFILLVFSALLLFVAENKKLRAAIGVLIVGSAFFLGIYNVFAKLVFTNSSFLIGFVWIKLGGALTALILLSIPSLRRRVFEASRESKAENRLLYFSNRTYAGLGSILFTYALSLTHPALADATQGFRYIVIFFAGWLILHERFRGKVLVAKILATFLVLLGLILVGLVEYAKTLPVDTNRHIEWGITFSDKFSRKLGLNWRENYSALLNELHPKKLRLIAYWDDIENTKDQYDFSDLDWEIARASESGANVILALGMKVPRWPECHIPGWASALDTERREDALRTFMRRVVERYWNNSEIKIWQIENEPYLRFGRCPERGDDFLAKEIALVKSLDSSRKILVTDGGEFGLWYKAARTGEVFGTTMYREAYPLFIGPIFGPVDYHIDPAYFRLKRKVVRLILGDENKRFIVIELQGEPWGYAEIQKLTYQEQIQLFSPEYFRATIDYAKETGFDEYYLWGVEWWYWLKVKQNNPEIWEVAKRLIVANN